MTYQTLIHLFVTYSLHLGPKSYPGVMRLPQVLIQRSLSYLLRLKDPN